MKEILCVPKGGFTQTVIFSVGCDFQCRNATIVRINPIFCVVLHVTVASDTENHGSCKHPLNMPFIA
jgi:hypothetical protein